MAIREYPFMRLFWIRQNKIWTFKPEYGKIKIAVLGFFLAIEVQLINVNSKMRKIEIIFKAKKAHLPLDENIIFSKDIDSLDLQYFMRLCRI